MIEFIQRYFPKVFPKVQQLMAHGATTHPDDMEWREKAIKTHLDHATAHMAEFEYGRTVDPESGQCHLVNAATRLLMAAELQENG